MKYKNTYPGQAWIKLLLAIFLFSAGHAHAQVLRKVLTCVATLQGTGGDPVLTVDQATSMIFTASLSVDKIVRFESLDQYGLSNEGVVPIQIDEPVSNYHGKIGDLVTKLNERLTAAGYNLSTYNSIVYIMPAQQYLGAVAQGVATTGDGFIRIFNGSLGVIVHEMGHNIGFNHSKRWVNGVLNNYGDKSCLMGRGTLNSTSSTGFNAAWKFRAGWLSAANGTAARATATASYSLVPLSSPASRSGLRVVEIPRPDDSNDRYFISYLKDDPAGMFGRVYEAEFKDAVTIHRVPAAGWGMSEVVGTLKAGQTFTDDRAKFSVRADGISSTATSHDSASAEITVQSPLTYTVTYTAGRTVR